MEHFDLEPCNMLSPPPPPPPSLGSESDDAVLCSTWLASGVMLTSSLACKELNMNIPHALKGRAMGQERSKPLRLSCVCADSGASRSDWLS